ncbi:MAG TPA: SDR family NAD(P)-dependent oxidoreductase [Aliidongia sp.]|uniref:SDR family NAD(P)-dependent oxidoreductase n=1 Tax=Aliidongia sp. TaxID=1914230 RepID=UPI002DDDB38C|nr:SDR family NAD(P)-dependent oxidoreductase [Aliidongia sp.]HEV2673192.1 SDR family NAD(P)-dependent oxidoreductase [Aliidongia sp.]
MNQIDLAGRRAIVTGGARGIGLAVAQRLAASGARVAIWDRDATTAAAEADRIGQVGLAVDVADPEGVEAAFGRSVALIGPIDILVTSAGITGPNLPVEDYPVDAWRQVLDVDLTGPFLCSRAVVAGMRARDYGRIVHIASIAGKEGNPNASAYSAAKAGVIALTKSLGKELAQTGVRVNCVTPAAVRTEIFDQMTEQHIQYMLSKIPMGRFGLATEIAAMIAWLVSEECSFSTGATFDLSGGRAVY